MDKYKSVIVAASLFSILTTNAWASPKDNDYSENYDSKAIEKPQQSIGENGEVILDPSDMSVFKPAALKSLEDFNDHYRLYKYDTISVKIIGFRDAQGLDNIMIGTDGYVNLPYAGSVKLAGLTIEEAKQVLTAKFGRYIKIPDMSVMVNSYGPRIYKRFFKWRSINNLIMEKYNRTIEQYIAIKTKISYLFIKKSK